MSDVKLDSQPITTNSLDVQEVFVTASPYETALSFTDNDWRARLQNAPDFNGDLKNASRVLLEMCDGIKATRDKFFRKGLLSYRPPIIGIVHGEDAKKITIRNTIYKDMSIVLVSIDFLSKLSRLDFDRIGYIARNNNEPVFYGHAKDFAYLTGVEEAHHASYRQFKGKENRPSPLNPNDMSLDEYDAIEHEFRALLFQKRMAKERKMPQETIDFITTRIENAQRFRQESKKS